MTTNSQERKWRIEVSMKFLTTGDNKKIIIKLMTEWGISRRIAKEYLDVMWLKNVDGK